LAPAQLTKSGEARPIAMENARSVARADGQSGIDREMDADSGWGMVHLPSGRQTRPAATNGGSCTDER
jgi:hypothetical protein